MNINFWALVRLYNVYSIYLTTTNFEKAILIKEAYEKAISCITFGGPKKLLLFAGSENVTIKMFVPTEQSPRAIFTGHQGPITCIIPIKKDPKKEYQKKHKKYEEKHKDIEQKREFVKKILEKENPQVQTKILVGPEGGPKKELKVFKSLLIKTDKK